jgi:hypothetical protein
VLGYLELHGYQKQLLVGLQDYEQEAGEGKVQRGLLPLGV